ncbi:hypothetical protein [Hymenobacter koreensis]|uniref:DNA-binding protein n=1 Tax=Hymenobacter koreensis TaxID=1084523 RepID=A0ABP8JK78_9BACT
MTQAPPLKIDRFKCFTPQAYAEKEKMNLRTVYRRIEQKQVPTVEISGVVFIYIG